MGVSLTSLTSLVNALIKFTDTNILSNTDRQLLIEESVKKYSKKRPLIRTEIYTGTTSNYYTLPSNFEDGFSEFYEIEYPVESDPKEIIQPKYWAVEQMGTGKQLRFYNNNPGSGNTFWAKYTSRHIFSSGTSDIPESDETALAYLCASLFCDTIADYYASRSDPNLPEVQIPGFDSRTAEWQSQAKRWMKKYDEEIIDTVSGVEGQIDFSQDMFFDRNPE
jgi:hypothetical protein